MADSPPALPVAIDLTQDDSDNDEATTPQKKNDSSGRTVARGRLPPALRRLDGAISVSPLHPDNLDEPSRFIRDRIMGRIISQDLLRLPEILKKTLLEKYTEGYGLYALRTRDHVRKSIAQLRHPRKPAEELRQIIRLEVPPSVLTHIVLVADLAAAYIWGCLPNRLTTVPVTSYDPAHDLVPMSESSALNAIAEISIMVAQALWGQHTSYAIQIQRSQLFEPGYDVAPQTQDCEFEDLCRVCRSVKSHAVKLMCGCTFCFVCVRIHFDEDFRCPLCEAVQYRPPMPAVEVRERIRHRLLPDVDNSRVDYSWQGLHFPARPRPLVRCSCAAAEMCECAKVNRIFCDCIAASICRCLSVLNEGDLNEGGAEDVLPDIIGPDSLGVTSHSYFLRSGTSNKLLSWLVPTPKDCQRVPWKLGAARPPSIVESANADEVREKQRIRMAERRARRRANPVLHAEDQARVKVHNSNYRARHPERLAEYARGRRDRAFMREHGQEALTRKWGERRQREEEERQRAEQEEIERRRQTEQMERQMEWQRDKEELRRRRKELLKEVEAEDDECADVARLGPWPGREDSD
ncbi:hypothetical protein C8F01DRAFT_1263313 [Mycena amicta]|nr:hypothetical protein C8F01DRAFT_1263313 [Mycena amicta]